MSSKWNTICRAAGLEQLQRSGVQLSESLAVLGIIGAQLRARLKPIEHHSSMVSRRLRGNINSTRIMPRGTGGVLAVWRCYCVDLSYCYENVPLRPLRLQFRSRQHFPLAKKTSFITRHWYHCELTTFEWYFGRINKLLLAKLLWNSASTEFPSSSSVYD